MATARGNRSEMSNIGLPVVAAIVSTSSRSTAIAVWPSSLDAGVPSTASFRHHRYVWPPAADESVTQMLDEVTAVHALGAANIFVVDDNFIGNKKDAKALLTALAGWQEAHGYPIEFILNVAQDAELLRLLKLANFVVIFVGIESPRGASLRETNKTQNMREDIVTSIHRIRAAGIEVMAGMIVGFDNDDASICDEQFRFIQEARIPISMTGMLDAVPKTALHARLKAAGRLIADLVGDQSVFTKHRTERHVAGRSCRAGADHMALRSASVSAARVAHAVALSGNGVAAAPPPS